MKTAAALLLLLAAATTLPAALALSWPLCDPTQGGSVWVTERPHTGPTFPGANLWFFCEGGLNILGAPVDACANNGLTCSPAVLDTTCQLLGFDRAVPEQSVVAPASTTDYAKSVTGEVCLRKGVYANTAPNPDALAALPGEPCSQIARLACIRTASTMAAVLERSLTALAAPAAEAASAAAPMPEPAVTSAAGPGNRKLLL